ncbi:hypothetical protein ACU8KH_06015 [Lachancea thermotolerans]
MDETGVEPMTSPMLRERATNYATRPIDEGRGWVHRIVEKDRIA